MGVGATMQQNSSGGGERGDWSHDERWDCYYRGQSISLPYDTEFLKTVGQDLDEHLI